MKPTRTTCPSHPFLLCLALLALLLLPLSAQAATYNQPFTASFGAAQSGKAASVLITVYDASNTVQIAATNAPGGTAAAESTDAAGTANTGTYRFLLPMNTDWYPARVKAVITGVNGACVEWVFGSDRAGAVDDGYTASAQATLIANFTTMLARIPQTVLFDPNGFVRSASQSFNNKR